MTAKQDLYLMYIRYLNIQHIEKMFNTGNINDVIWIFVFPLLCLSGISNWQGYNNVGSLSAAGDVCMITSSGMYENASSVALPVADAMMSTGLSATYRRVTN